MPAGIAETIATYAPTVYNVVTPLVGLGIGVYAAASLFDYIKPESALAQIATSIGCIGLGFLVTGAFVAATHPFTPIKVAVMTSTLLYTKVFAAVIAGLDFPRLMLLLMV